MSLEQTHSSRPIDPIDAIFNLYQKGSLDIDTIYELLNLDPESITERLYKDLFTLKDSTFNERLRIAYGRIGDALVDDSDITEKTIKSLGSNEDQGSDQPKVETTILAKKETQSI